MKLSLTDGHFCTIYVTSIVVDHSTKHHKSLVLFLCVSWWIYTPSITRTMYFYCGNDCTRPVFKLSKQSRGDKIKGIKIMFLLWILENVEMSRLSEVDQKSYILLLTMTSFFILNCGSYNHHWTMFL